MRFLRLGLRGFGVVLVMAYGVAFVLSLLPVRLFSQRLHARMLQFMARDWFRQMQRILGVEVTHAGAPAQGPVLLAANHVSWLDIIVLGSSIGACFVSKSEVASWPVMGWLAKQGGTLFIHRGRHDSAAHIAHEMHQRLEQGERLLFFPEGTTSDGTSIKRFKNRLFQPALHAGAKIQPVAIVYRLEGPRDPVAYVDDVSFLESIVGVAGRACTEVSLRWCEAFPAEGERRDLAERAESEVASALTEVRALQGFPAADLAPVTKR